MQKESKVGDSRRDVELVTCIPWTLVIPRWRSWRRCIATHGLHIVRRQGRLRTNRLVRALDVDEPSRRPSELAVPHEHKYRRKQQ